MVGVTVAVGVVVVVAVGVAVTVAVGVAVTVAVGVVVAVGMKTTVSKEIYKFLRENGGFVASGELEGKKFLNATAQTIGRKARKLASEGWLEVRYQQGTHHAEYRAVRTKEEKEKVAANQIELVEQPKFEEGVRLWSVLVPVEGGKVVRQTTDMRVRDSWLSIEGARCL